MTTSALVMMLLTWALIGYFTVRFFRKVVKSQKQGEPEQ